MNTQKKANNVVLKNFPSLGKYCQKSFRGYFFLPHPVDTDKRQYST